MDLKPNGAKQNKRSKTENLDAKKELESKLYNTVKKKF
jgi:hypothetical protein